MKEQDRQAALEALCEITSWANKGVDTCTRGKTVPDIYSLKQAILSAITAPDVNVELLEALYGTIKSQKQTHDALIKMNKELLDACKVVLGHMTGGMDGDWRDCDPIILLRDTIYRAEAQKVEED